jgi:hypothetical protein
MTSEEPAARVPRPLRRRLVRTTLGAGPSRPDADASDERIVELWLRDAVAQSCLTAGRAAPGRDRALPAAHGRREAAARLRDHRSALYGTGARVDELVQLRRRQLVADIDGPGGYVTLYGKHGGRTIRVGRRTWNALQFLADGKEPDERIIAITDERAGQRRFRPAARFRCRPVPGEHLC